MAVLGVNKVEASVGLEGHERSIGFRRPNISKLDGPRNVSCQPRQHLHLKAVRPGLPLQLVNVGAYKPVKGSSGGST